ncbi:MAG TPA: response regulator [Phycisphaerae bacterium]|nr:response regulator [Phycisphaerae bacterium]HNU44018.1 response regulator [Phycisphaerae bacterium]
MNTQAKHIVLIDDDPDMREAIRMVLEPLGYRLTCCATGAQGLSVLRQDGADLLLLDIMLSTPTEGIDLCQSMKGDPKLRALPIIMISAVGQTTGMDIALEAGGGVLPAELFLEKPLEAQVLRDAVQRFLSNKE